MISPWKVAQPTTVSAPTGCLECRNTGYRGRLGIYEILTMSAGLRKIVRPDTDMAILREQALKEGMRPLRIAAAQKVYAGLTTLEEVMGIVTFAE